MSSAVQGHGHADFFKSTLLTLEESSFLTPEEDQNFSEAISSFLQAKAEPCFLDTRQKLTFFIDTAKMRKKQKQAIAEYSMAQREMCNIGIRMLNNNSQGDVGCEQALKIVLEEEQKAGEAQFSSTTAVKASLLRICHEMAKLFSTDPGLTEEQKIVNKYQSAILQLPTFPVDDTSIGTCDPHVAKGEQLPDQHNQAYDSVRAVTVAKDIVFKITDRMWYPPINKRATDPSKPYKLTRSILELLIIIGQDNGMDKKELADATGMWKSHSLSNQTQGEALLAFLARENIDPTAFVGAFLYAQDAGNCPNDDKAIRELVFSPSAPGGSRSSGPKKNQKNNDDDGEEDEEGLSRFQRFRSAFSCTVQPRLPREIIFKGFEVNEIRQRFETLREAKEYFSVDGRRECIIRAEGILSKSANKRFINKPKILFVEKK